MFTVKSFYKSKEWERFRDIIIAERTNKDDGLLYCEHCNKPIVKKYDIVVHHKKELTDLNVNDYNISLNPDNVEVIHFDCHNKEHGRFGYEANKKVYIVFGAPFSDKEEWVNAVAQPNDLIVDMDNIYECISNSNRYVNTDRLKSVAFEVRDKLYDVIKYRSGKWQNAFVITGSPLKGDRERLIKRLNADEVKLIDSTKRDCYKKLLTSNISHKKMDQLQKIIDDWFTTYQK